MDEFFVLVLIARKFFLKQLAVSIPKEGMRR